MCREPQAICNALYEALPEDVKRKLLFVLEDINDSDLLSYLSGIKYKHVLIFCNNLAFTEGTLNRCVLTNFICNRSSASRNGRKLY